MITAEWEEVVTGKIDGKETVNTLEPTYNEIDFIGQFGWVVSKDEDKDECLVIGYD